MARKKRIWYEGACYHVMGRGNRRAKVFLDEDDYTVFMRILTSTKERYPFDLHAYCLMTNHFHLELTTSDEPIWKIMQFLMNSYARTFNKKHGFDGHLFDSRYASGLIEDNVYFLEVSRYIHLNPVKAHMVRNPLDYKYSSYGQYVSDDIRGSSKRTYEGPGLLAQDAARRMISRRRSGSPQPVLRRVSR